jgi:gluconolactonase
VKPSQNRALVVLLGSMGAACAAPRERASEPAPAQPSARDATPAGCPAGPFAAPLPENASVTQIAGVPPAGYAPGASSNVEGPLWLGDSLYVSHLQEGVQNPPPSRILKITGDTLSVFMPEAGTNGLALGNDGAVIAARHADGSLSRLDLATKTFTPLVTAYENARFGSPNDLAVRSDGNIYFSDPDYQAPTPRPQPKTRVYRVAPDGSVTAIDENRTQPNGVTLSADERTLYVASPNAVHRYEVASDGSVGPPAQFSTTGSDGMAMDCAGNLYLSAGRDIVVLAASGATIGTLKNAVPEGASSTNVAFGGPDRRRLFITARGAVPGLWYVDLRVPGRPY